MALEISHILESSHIKHIDCSIVRTSQNFAIRQLYSHIHCSSVILSYVHSTDEKDADFAIFLTPIAGMLANVYIKAFGLDYLWLGVAGELLR
jgi:hypothetical protein